MPARIAHRKSRPLAKLAIMIEAALEQARRSGRRYEETLAQAQPALRKANGVYYTPAAIVDHVVKHALGTALRARTQPITVLDPACGCGAFLVAANQCLVDWARRDRKRRSLLGRVYGIDQDQAAIGMARSALAAATGGLALPDSIRCGNSLTSDWSHEFPDIMSAGGFDVVIGNPPWGQKEIAKDERVKRSLQQRFPSSAGIFDLFRPFVELGVRLTKDGGWFGMVLPDIVLLKDYPRTRQFLLEHLTLERIDTWGMAFSGAVIDVVTIIGRKRSPPARHSVCVGIADNGARKTHKIPQANFCSNPRHVFNVHLTPERRRVIDQLASCPRLGEYFEVHEGVHSGNIRETLFVNDRLDDTCRELLFGRDEIVAYGLRWHGRYLRLGAVPARKTRDAYANVGRHEWHERAKVLVRRTGDHVLAAVDRKARYASNNFFLVFPKRPAALDFDGMCALLNSRFMSWYFRVIEPRQGRAFAELKIKHLVTFPLPIQALQANGCRKLNKLGLQRGNLVPRAAGFTAPVRPHQRAKPDGTLGKEAVLPLDAAIDAEVLRLFGLRVTDIQ